MEVRSWKVESGKTQGFDLLNPNLEIGGQRLELRINEMFSRLVGRDGHR